MKIRMCNDHYQTFENNYFFTLLENLVRFFKVHMWNSKAIKKSAFSTHFMKKYTKSPIWANFEKVHLGQIWKGPLWVLADIVVQSIMKYCSNYGEIIVI